MYLLSLSVTHLRIAGWCCLFFIARYESRSFCQLDRGICWDNFATERKNLEESVNKRLERNYTGVYMRLEKERHRCIDKAIRIYVSCPLCSQFPFTICRNRGGISGKDSKQVDSDDPKETISRPSDGSCPFEDR
jgi:hypothetical protein